MENGVWVYVENDGATIADVSLELLGKGRELADQLRSELAAIIIGHGVAGLAPKVIQYGADKVYVAEHPELDYYLTLPYARITVEFIEKYRPSILLIGATNRGRDLAPRISSHMRTGLTADCTDLQISDITYLRQNYKELLLQIRPAFGGNIIATIITPDAPIQMATVREGVMENLPLETSEKGKITEIPYSSDEIDDVIKHTQKH